MLRAFHNDGIVGRSFRWICKNGFTFSSPMGRSNEDMSKRMINLPTQDELYNPRKAAQMIAYFVLRQGERAIDIVKVVKLIYLADRESLRRWGVPFLHEPRASLPQGPVNQTTLDYIDGKRVDERNWSPILAARSKSAIGIMPAVGIADLDEFNDGERQVLDDLWTKHGAYKWPSLVKWTHNSRNVPEWVDPHGSSTPIELIDILRAVQFPDPAAAIARIDRQRAIERSLSKYA